MPDTSVQHNVCIYVNVTQLSYVIVDDVVTWMRASKRMFVRKLYEE